jgi:hypothetical protein
MLTTIELLELLQIEAAKLGANPTDYAAAKLIGASHQAVSGWRNGNRGMSDKLGLKTALTIGLPPAYVVACLTAERHKNGDLYSLYCEIAKRLSPAKQDYHHAA